MSESVTVDPLAPKLSREELRAVCLKQIGEMPEMDFASSEKRILENLAAGFGVPYDVLCADYMRDKPTLRLECERQVVCDESRTIKVIGEKSGLDFLQAIERLRSSMTQKLSEYLDYAAVGPADIDALEKESRERLRMMDVIAGVKHFRDPRWPMPEKRRSRSALTPAQRDERRARNKAQRKARKRNR